MKQLFLMVNDGSVELIETPAPKVKTNYVIVETLYSTISSGTERGLASFGSKNLLQKAKERPDQVKQVIDKMSTDGILTTIDAAFNKLKEPFPIGYSGVGRVIECGKGITDIDVGDLVAMAGQAYHSEINRVNRNLIVKLHKDFGDPRQAALCALGGIALQGIHQAKVEPGESIAVIGLGLLGHITARILNAYGCNVIGYDITDKQLDKTDLQTFILSSDPNIEETTKGFTKFRGVDKVIITAATNSNQPMDLAAKIVRDRGIICMVGVTQMNIDRRPYYEKELTFTLARSYGPGRYETDYEEKGIDYPIGYVRFTEGRNLEEFVRLIHEKRVDFSDLITHEIPFVEAEKAYDMITSGNEDYIGILLKYSSNEKKLVDTVNGKNKKAKRIINDRKINVGIIGAGNFAKNTLVPNMLAAKRYNLVALATTGGVGSAQMNKLFDFEYITNDYRKLLEDESIDLIAISTPHNTHAKLIIESLSHDKHVYCEKPLCLTTSELTEIKQAYAKSESELFVGLNRRHSPLIQRIKMDLKTNKIPAVYEYIANAGFLPKDHWTQNESLGGGRIIGEAVHFIDVIQYLDGSEISSMNITFANNAAYPSKDNAIINIKFSSGAIANIIYTSMGSKKYPKEFLRVFSNGQVIELNNYLHIKRFSLFSRTKFKLRQNKGFVEQYTNYSNILSGKSTNNQIVDVFSATEHLLTTMQR